MIVIRCRKRLDKIVELGAQPWRRVPADQIFDPDSDESGHVTVTYPDGGREVWERTGKMTDQYGWNRPFNAGRLLLLELPDHYLDHPDYITYVGMDHASGVFKASPYRPEEIW